MEPIKFEEANAELLKPKSMTDEECVSLPVFRDGDQCISRWKLSWLERFSIFFSGMIWVGVLSGVTQPPIWLSVEESVFNHPEKDGGQ